MERIITLEVEVRSIKARRAASAKKVGGSTGIAAGIALIIAEVVRRLLS